MSFEFKKSIILPIIALFVCVSVGIAVIAYKVNIKSLERIQAEREKEKSDNIVFIIRAVVENHERALRALVRILQENKELSEGLAYFSASGNSDPVNDVVGRLFPTLNTDIFLLTDVDGKVVATEVAREKGIYPVRGVKRALNGAVFVGAEEGPEGWAIRAMAPIYWPLGGDLYGTVVVGILIGDTFAQRIAKAIEAQISFAHPEGEILASSAPAEYKRLIQPEPSVKSLLEGKSLLYHDPAQFISTLYVPISIADETFCLIIQQDMSKSIEQLNQKRRNLWWMLSGIVGLVFLAALWLVYFVVRPLKSLEARTQNMINDFSGDYAYVGRGNEIDRLTKSFDFMLKTLSSTMDSLQQSEEKFRTILDNVGAGYYELDLTGNITYCTEVAAFVMGGSVKDFEGKSFAEFCDEENAQALSNTYQNIYETGQPAKAVEWDIAAPDGSEKSVEASAALIRNADGEPIGYQGIVLDITERRKAEEELKNSRRRLAEIIDFLPDPTWVVDARGRLVAWNRAIEKLTGVEAKDILGKGDFEYALPFYNERRPVLIDLVRNWDDRYKEKYVSLRKVGDDLISEESFHPHLGDGGIYLAAVARVLYNSEGQPAGAIESARDITDRKKVEEELKKAKKAAEEANRSKSDFLANMSHEIRTPMNAIIGMTHLALKTELSPKQSDYLQKIRTSANSLLGIINDILDFSKIEAGKLDMELVEFSLDEVMDNLAALVTVKSQEKENLEVLFDIASGTPCFLVGDPLRLGQVLINLASNAVKFTEEGEIVISVHPLKQEIDRVTLEFSVSDTGIGLTGSQMDNLFQAFTQGDTSTTRKYGGTGLGLSICKRLVDMMGGEIRVESKLGRGSTFSFTANFARSGRRERKMPEKAPDLKGLRVLVVDDNSISREILMAILESFRFDVSLAGTGEEGLKELESASGNRPYDLVLMDWKMPGMNGIEASKRIKNHPGLSKIPTIIMVTAYGREEIMRQAGNLGLEGFLIKPISPSVLFDAIMQAFSRKEFESASKGAPADRVYEECKGIRGAKILLVEDNEINQQVARELLEGVGLIVTIAGNGHEALRVLQGESFDAVLMDIQMPGLDGYQTTFEIRKDERFAALPIIAMTAHAMAGDQEKCIDAGMNDYVSKPIDPEKLFSALVRWIEPGERIVPDHIKAEARETLSEDECRPLPDLPGISVRSGLAKVAGDRKLYRKLLDKFRLNHGEAANEIGNALNAGDQESAARITHTIKGLAGTIGAQDLHLAAATLDTALRQGETENVQEFLNVFSESLGVVLNSIANLDAQEPAALEKSASALPCAESIDYDRVFSLIGKLKKLLKEDDTQAVRTLETLREALAPGSVENEMASLEKHIGRYAFEEALQTLDEVAHALNEAREGGQHG